jgi:hypothetical protein
MELNLSVNGVHGSQPGELDRLLSAGAPPQASKGDQGPCLYLGEAGQRCSRRAVEGGFCLAHQGQRDSLNRQVEEPSEQTKRVAGRSRMLAAAIGLVGILGPYVYDLVREILRWIHAR